MYALQFGLQIIHKLGRSTFKATIKESYIEAVTVHYFKNIIYCISDRILMLGIHIHYKEATCSIEYSPY